MHFYTNRFVLFINHKLQLQFFSFLTFKAKQVLDLKNCGPVIDF